MHHPQYYLTRDQEIRQAFHKEWISPRYLSNPASKAVDELVLMRGKHRVDIAVLNDEFHGFEIKSAADNLDRLPSQQECYNKVFDRISLVIDERHIERAVTLVPACWGLLAVRRAAHGTVIDEIWPARRNFKLDPLSLAQLLWRDEAIQILAERNIARGLRDKPRKVLWKAVSEKLVLEDLRNAVREAMKARTDWRE